MSFPNIPDVDASIDITREDSLNLLLASIAFEELGLSHVINAEAEKVQYALGTLVNQEGEQYPVPPLAPTIEDLLKVNNSVQKTMQTVIKEEMLLQFKLEDILSIPTCVSSTFDFPSEDSTVVGSYGIIDDDEMGYFWSVARGDHVGETFAAGDYVNIARLNVEVVRNVLAPGAFVNWELVINGEVVGSFTVEDGFTGEISVGFNFPKITGPIYQVDLRVANQVPVGDGSITLAYASDFAHSLTLTYCDQLGAAVAKTAGEKKTRRAPSHKEQEYSLELNNREPQ